MAADPTVSTPSLGIAALGRASLVYALGGLAYKGVALLSVPILARVLGPAELGLLDLAAVMASIIGLSAAVGTDTAVTYFEPRVARVGQMWGSALGLIGATSLVFIAISFVFREALAAQITGDADHGSIVAGAAVYGGVLAQSACALSAVRLHGTPRAYALASFAIVTAEMAGALGIALFVASPVPLMVLAWAAAASAVAIPVLLRYVPEIRAPDMQMVRRIVSYGAPLVPAVMVWLVADAWIRSAIAQDGDLTALGAYGIAYRVASVIGLVVTGFGVAWRPYIFGSSAAEVADRAADVAAYALIGLAWVAVALVAFAPEVVSVFAGPGYASAVEAIPGLAGGMVAFGAFILVGGVVGWSGSMRRMALAAVVGAAVQVLLAAPLVSQQGLAGAGLASAAGYLVAAILLAVVEPRLHQAHTIIGMVVAAAIAGGGIGLTATFSGEPLLSRSLVLAAFSFGLVAAVLVFRKLLPLRAGT